MRLDLVCPLLCWRQAQSTFTWRLVFGRRGGSQELRHPRYFSPLSNRLRTDPADAFGVIASMRMEGMNMKLNRTHSVIDYKLYSRFDHLRQKLLADKPRELLDKPLAFWTVPNDRRLPLAFMGRSIYDLLTTPFEELYSTAGVGQKKIAGLVDLLTRVSTLQTPDDMLQPATNHRKAAPIALPGDPDFDPATVSESSFEQWRASVARFGLEKECLGRFASSLQDLPRVVWSTPLETYIPLSLAEIRALKTHGEKRVRVVVEIFGALHRILGSGPPVEYLSTRIRPKFIGPLEAWVLDALQRPLIPDPNEIRRSWIEPIMQQVRIDAGDQIARLTEGRLGLSGKGSSVRDAAKKLRLTRARVYQLLNDVNAILSVRWPEGQPLGELLRTRIQIEAEDRHAYEQFFTGMDLFFPQRRRIGSLASNGHHAGLELAGQRQAG